MPKLLVLRGLQASGKTTFAKSLVKDSGNYFRLNRDDLRAMMFDSKWTREREKVVIEVEKALARAILEQGYSVVIDDTGFRDPGWAELAPAILETKTFDTPLEECIRRDALRENPVGRNVITKTAARNGLIEWTKPIVICDIDGTLAQNGKRLEYLKQEKKNWDSYYHLLHEDTPIIPIFKWMAELSKENHIVLVSGRPDTYLEKTLSWFQSIWSPRPLFRETEVPKFPIYQVFFRDRSDRRPDFQVKKDILNLLPREKVWLVADDRPQVLKMWREEKIPWVVAVGGEQEDF